MNSQSKKFSRKLLALFLALVMALSTVFGVLSAYGATYDGYSKVADRTDTSLAANFLAWAEATDEQTCEALLDYADYYLIDKGVLNNLGATLKSLINSIGAGDYISVSYDNAGYAKITVKYVITLATINCYFDSVDGIIQTIQNIYSGVTGSSTLSSMLGDLGDLDLDIQSILKTSSSGSISNSNSQSACGYGYRDQYTAKEIIMAVAKLLYNNEGVIKTFLDGDFDLGTVGSLASIDIYGSLQSTLGCSDGYEDNFVYSIVESLILNETGWFTDDEISAYTSGSKTFNLDTVLFDKLSTELMQKINVEVTYPSVNGDDTNTSSRLRYQNIISIVGDSCEQGSSAWVSACSSLSASEGVTYDPNLRYTESGNVYLFRYGSDALEIDISDSLFDVAYNALIIAWNTVLQDTLSLIHVNYSVDRGKGTNFDNQFYYWVVANGGWDTADWTNNYADSIVEAWAEDVYADYGASSAEEFLTKNVKANYEYDRTIVDDAQNNWQDIDSTTLFNKLRYSPLADKYFDMQTGPINLYFAQTGISAISDFFENDYSEYSSIIGGLNDCLVAVCEVIFPNSSNIGFENEEGTVDSLSVPELGLTGDSTDATNVVETLMENICAMVEYVGNSIDANIFGGYYATNGASYDGTTVNLEEDNAEEMLLPLLIACIQNITMTEPIHDEKWDACKDAEGVAIVCLEEYLSYVLPDKDYSILWEIDADGYIEADMETALFPMCRDALGYIISGSVPCRTADGSVYDPYTIAVDDETTIFDIFNSVLCYYASDYEFDASGLVDSSITESTIGKAVASLLGVVDTSGNCLVSFDNTLWENIDAIVNTLFPVIGALQNSGSMTDGVSSDDADSYDLIYNHIIKGFLEIGDNDGISGFLTLFIDICNSDPISEDSIVAVVYDDLLAPLINAVFGARYSGQSYSTCVPYASYYDSDSSSATDSETPFDSFLQKEIIADYQSKGCLSILIINVVEAFGGTVAGVSNKGSYGSSASAGVNGCWDALGFILVAVNSFVPSFIPQLSSQTLSTADIELATTSYTGVSSGSSLGSNTLTISNESKGLNQFYIDENGKVQEQGRYYFYVTGISATNGTNTSTTTVSSSNATIAPEKSTDFTVSMPNTAGSDGTVTIEITYDIYQAKAGESKTTSNTVASGLKLYAYASYSSTYGWEDVVYPSDRHQSDSVYWLNESLEATSATTKTVNGYSATTVAAFTFSSTFSTSSMWLTVPSVYLMSTDMLESDMSAYQIRLKNGSSTSAKGIDQMYSCISSGDTYYLKSGTSLSSTMTTATSSNTSYTYVACDTDGNVINYNYVDYSTDGGTTWERGTYLSGYGYAGVSTTSVPDGATTRTHVVLTIDEALQCSNFYAAMYTTAADGTKIYSAMLFNAANIITNACAYYVFATSVQGINFCDISGTSVSKNSSTYISLFEWDGETEYSYVDATVAICAYNSTNKSMTANSTNLIIYSSDAISSLESSIDSALSYLNGYQQSDFEDYDGSSSETYQELSEAIKLAQVQAGAPITVSGASDTMSTTETVATTASSTSIYGDAAYVPVTYTWASSNGLPSSLWAGATVGSDGILYWNEECTMPIYRNTALSDSDIVYVGEQATDGAGQNVVKGDDGVWYLLNDVIYETTWDTTTFTYPIVVSTDVETGTYAKKQFVYRNSSGSKVNSTDDWSFKLSSSTTQTKAYDGVTDYRSIYEQLADYLTYVQEVIVAPGLATDYAINVYNDVTLDRTGMNNVNYNVVSYEKAVKIAKVAEKMISTSTDDDGEVSATTSKSKLQISEAISQYEFYMTLARSTARGYIGDALEAEIECASGGYTYSQLSAEETDGVYTSVTNASAANTTAKYGAYDENGVLQNTGEIIYTAESWANYIDALGAAAVYATEGNADETSKTVSATYTVKTALQTAENNLEEYVEEEVSDTITISGLVGISTNADGTAYSYLLKNGDEETSNGSVVFVEGDEVLGYIDADGYFEIELTAGVEHTITVKNDYAIEREITVSADCTGATDVEIALICFDYDNDGVISSSDAAALAKNYGSFVFAYDLDNDGVVSSSDKAAVAELYGEKLAYADMTVE